MRKFLSLCLMTVALVGIGAAGQHLYDRDDLQTRYDQGYQDGYDKGVGAWPELREQFRSTHVCEWARMMVLSKTCTEADVAHGRGK